MKKIIIVLSVIFLSGCGVSSKKMTTAPLAGEYPTTYKEALGPNSFGTAVCNELPSNWVQDIINVPVVSTEDFTNQTDSGCRYLINKDTRDHLLISVNFLDSENQKKGQQMLGRNIDISSAINMEHYIAKNPDGQINAIYLVLAPKKYVRVERTSEKVADDDGLVTFAAKVATVIRPQ